MWSKFGGPYSWLIGCKICFYINDILDRWRFSVGLWNFSSNKDLFWFSLVQWTLLSQKYATIVDWLIFTKLKVDFTLVTETCYVCESLEWGVEMKVYSTSLPWKCCADLCRECYNWLRSVTTILHWFISMLHMLNFVFGILFSRRILLVLKDEEPFPSSPFVPWLCYVLLSSLAVRLL